MTLRQQSAASAAGLGLAFLPPVVLALDWAPPRPAPITLLDSEARLPEALCCVGMLTFQPTTIAFDPSFPGRILSQVGSADSRARPLAACV